MAEDTPHTSRLNFTLPEDEKKTFKAAVATRGEKMTTVMRRLIQSYITTTSKSC